MVFSSFEFIFIFLPITVTLFWLLVKVKFRYAYFLGMAWLVLASLFFYSWWNPDNLWLILFSIVFNYCTGLALNKENSPRFQRRLTLGTGILVNLSLLGYFKYLGFFIKNVNRFSGLELNFTSVALPLAISFFTFQQIGYLVDTYKHPAKNYKFSEYLLFVSFFPQLIAGPIVHHKELIPQLSKKNFTKINSRGIALGLTIFSMGLFKKIIFADLIAVNANAVFYEAAYGAPPELFTAWIGVLSYTLQLYFDFSGYSDMAIGIAYLFGVQLPTNFNSPYKATSIADFWRRWHITLSNFLRDYLYIPLGGNRKGIARQNLNLVVTMALGGLWHGAGLTFIVWGALHGLYLVIHNQWRAFRKHKDKDKDKQESWTARKTAQVVTFLAVVVGWVFFRALNVGTAFTLLYSMVGGHGIVMPVSLAELLGPGQTMLSAMNVTFSNDSAMAFVITWMHIFALLAIAWLAPNTQSIVTKSFSAEVIESSTQQSPTVREKPEANKRPWKLTWQPTPLYGVVFSIILFISVKYMLIAPAGEFLYFNF